MHAHIHPAPRSRFRWFRAVAFLVAILLGISPAFADDNRTKIKPGIDRYSADQDVAIGHAAAVQLEHFLPMLKDARVNLYLSTLGNQLAVHAPGPRFAYEFHCVNSREINAFALPGGFIFVNRGTIEASRTESQLAAIIAHEIAHVALRHGTNQATKQEIWSAVGAASGIAGGLAGGAGGSIAGQLGGVFAANSVLLKYSRNAESQADVLGTQILADSGYDPRALGQFFELLNEENQKRPIEFFADHPNNDRRIERVNEEVEKMGGVPPHYTADSKEFREIRRYLLNLEPPHDAKYYAAAGQQKSSGLPLPPSTTVSDYTAEDFRLQFPDNWKQTGQGDAASFVPQGGMAHDATGRESAAYGVMVNLFQPAPKMASGDGGSAPTLEEATNQLIANLQQANPHMQSAGDFEKIRVDGEPALGAKLTNESPRGGRENDWVVAVMRPQGLLYFICIAPSQEYDDYDSSFQQLIASVRFTRDAPQ